MKIALISSVLTILLCFAMFLGTTFAWLTMEVSSGSNTVQAGNLDVELQFAPQPANATTQSTGETGGLQWVTATDAGVAMFSNISWEPGATGVVYFRVHNSGSLALKYGYTLDVVSNSPGTNNEGQSIDLTEYIQLTVIDREGNEVPLSPDDVNGLFNANSSTINQMLDQQGVEGDGDTGTVYQNSPGDVVNAGNDSKVIAVVAKMLSTAGNAANARSAGEVPSISLKLTVDATQATSESDSYDNQYDQNASYGGGTESPTNNESGESNVPGGS